MLTLTTAYKLSHTLSWKAMKIPYNVQQAQSLQVGGWWWEDGWKEGQPEVLLKLMKNLIVD